MKIELTTLELEAIVRAHIEKTIAIPEGHKILRVALGHTHRGTEIDIGIPKQTRAAFPGPQAEHEPAPPSPTDILPASDTDSEIF